MNIINSSYVVEILQFQQGQGPLCKNAGGCASFAPLVPTPLICITQVKIFMVCNYIVSTQLIIQMYVNNYYY